jgi:hypothetical protein
MDRTRVFLTIVFTMVTGTALAQGGASSCDLKNLPTYVSGPLATQLPGWRIKRTDDILVDYQMNLWKKKRSGQCPGIALGHFLSASENAYAFLLIPEAADQKGFKVIVVGGAEGKPTGSRVVVVEEAKDKSSGDIVIYRRPPGVYTSPDKDRRVQIHLDGVQVERMEVSTTIFYWQNDRFESLVMSD